MGQKQIENNSQDQLKIQHPRFSNPKFKKTNDTNEEYIQVKIPIVNEKQYQIWVKNLKDVPTRCSQSLLMPIGHKFNKEGLCGSSGHIVMNFQKFPFLLIDEISNRQSINHKQFQQAEVWYLIYTLISTSLDFHQKNVKVGDIRPQNIFINQDGQIKLATQYTWPNQQLNYYKSYYEKQITYLAPQQCKDLQFGKIQTSNPPQQTQAFSIGLTSLDSVLLGCSKICYGSNGKFLYNQLQGLINQMRKSQYSQLLVLVIANLCETETQNRCTTSQIYQWLQSKQDQINNLDEFTMNQIPDKINFTRQKFMKSNINVHQTQYSQPQKISTVPHHNIPTNIPQQSGYYQQPQPIYQNNVQIPPPYQLTAGVRGQSLQGQPIQYPQNFSQGFQQPQQYSQQPQFFLPGNNIPVSQSHYVQQQQSLYSQPIGVIKTNSPNKQNPQSNSRVGKKPDSNIGTNINSIQQSATVTPEYAKTLSKIDEQLQQSRQRFPS